MLHKRSAALILALTLPALAGCVQATRHSNTMVFGTNTSLAARVGQGVNQVPEISVGYGRQEAVIMPLLANTQDQGGRQGLLAPCGTVVSLQDPPVATASSLSTSDGSPHPCKFVATKTDGNNIISQDSYSVLASFGANIKARSPNGESGGDIGVGLAQYFATGVAAQLLAANGGAAVVAVSAGATKSAESTESGAATQAVTGTVATPAGSGKSFDEAWGKLKIEVGQAANPTERLQVINGAIGKAGLENDPVIPRLLRAECGNGKSTADCQAQLDAAVAGFNTRAFRNN